jgi:hypothetical protein
MPSSGTDDTGLVLTIAHAMLLESIFWLTLGGVLGWQDIACYEGANPEALFETVSSHG